MCQPQPPRAEEIVPAEAPLGEAEAGREAGR